MKHKNTVIRYQGNVEQLVEEIGDLYYDALATHLHLLAEKIAKDGKTDAARGRKKLAAELMACSEQLMQAAAHIDSAWLICKPFTDPVRKAAKP